MSEEFNKIMIGCAIAKKGHIPLELLGYHAQKSFWEIVEKKYGKEFAVKAKEEHEKAIRRKYALNGDITSV